MKFNIKKFLWGLKWAFITYLVIIIISIPIIIYLSIGLPSLEEIERYKAPNSTKVYDINGKLIYEFHEERRVPVKIKELPKHVIMAFVLLEDRKFFNHWGVDIDRIIKSAIKNIFTLSIKEGASTITQQLARNMFLTQERTITRKIREILLAIKIERTFSKEEILERYLNQIYMGGGLYGIQSAAEYYFGKTAKELNPLEASILAGIPKDPSRYSPAKNYDLSLQRGKFILKKLLYENKIITKDEYEKFKNYKPEIVYFKAPLSYGGIAPYFIDEVRKYVVSKYGEYFLFRGGGKIWTTLDSRIQEICNRIVDSMLNVYDKKFPTKPKYIDYNPKTKKPPKYLQVALVAIDNRTGYVLALIGGRNYYHSQFNRATQAYRQAGSAFKVFTYASAMEKGYNATDIVYDLPISIKLPDTVWQPENFDKEYLGPIPIWKAIALSKNLASVRLLLEIGPASASEMAKRLGIETNVPSYYSVALGAIDVRPIELINAFSTIASYGNRKKPILIIRIEDANGVILEENKPQSTIVMDSITAYLTINLLKHVVDAGTAIDARLVYKFGHPAGGKTGTTDDYRDAWFIGFTPDITLGVWFGYDSTRTIFPNATGTQLAVPVWSLIMKEIYKDKPKKDFYIPYGVKFVEVCRVSGKLPTKNCPRIYEPFREGREPKDYCPIHTSTKEVSDTTIEKNFLKELFR